MIVITRTNTKQIHMVEASSHGTMSWKKFFLHGEYEALSLEVPVSPYEMNRRIVSALFLGGGYRQFFGSYSSMNIMILFDAIQDQYSPYQNPIFRIGFDFGL